MHPIVLARRLLSATIAACTLAALSSNAMAALPKAAITEGYDDLAPFSQRLDIVLTGGFGNGTFTVPAGMRLVIDYISADVGCAVNGNVLFDVATYLNGNEVESHLPVFNNGVILGQQIYSVSNQTHIYADPLSTVTIAILGPSTGGGGAIVGVYGHFVPVP